MKYEELPSDVREKLEEHKFAMVRYSSLASEPNDKVDDVLLFTNGSEIDTDELEGYDKSSMVGVWFDFVAEGKSDEEAYRMALNSLMDVEPEWAEAKLKEFAGEATEVEGSSVEETPAEGVSDTASEA